MGWDDEVAAFVGPYNGRWPTRRDTGSLAGQRIVRRVRPLVLRSARWSLDSRVLTLRVAPEHPGPPSDVLEVFMYLPPVASAAPLIFASDDAPAPVLAALDRISAVAAKKISALPLLVDQVLDALAEEGSLLQSHMDTAGGAQAVDPGAFRDVIDFATSHPMTLDVLVCLAFAASKTFRRATLLDPFPSAFLASHGNPDLDRFAAALSCVPPIASLGNSHLAADALALVRWLMDLKGVFPKPDHVRSPDSVPVAGLCLGARREAVPVCELRLEHGDDPEFVNLEREFGSQEAFHGSALENMHCILRCGLKTFSGDKERMRTGDIFGQGVYLSSALGIARSFASRGLAWDKTQLGSYLAIVARCKVVLHPSVKRAKETVTLDRAGAHGAPPAPTDAPMDAFPHTYYVVPDERHVRVCSLLVFADGPPPAGDARRSGLALRDCTGSSSAREQGFAERGAAARAVGAQPPQEMSVPRWWWCWWWWCGAVLVLAVLVQAGQLRLSVLSDVNINLH